jgi:putative LPS biosynthesis related undPP-quiNAc-P-transferase
MLVQALVIIGYFLFQDNGYWYMGGTILLLSVIYILFMKRYFHLHKIKSLNS